MGQGNSFTEQSDEYDELSWPLPLPKRDLNKKDAEEPVSSTRKRQIIIFVIILSSVLVVLSLGLGLGLGLGLKKESATKTTTIYSSAGGGHNGVSSSPDSSSPVRDVACSPPDDSFASTATPWKGVNLGNWLVLERWMNPSYYAFYTGINETDEWSFCQSLQEDCGPVLETHWNEWLTETEISNLAQLGYNLLRVPIGFWAFIQPYAWEPYYKGSQTTQLTRLLSYAKTYNISIIIDLHGLPGSQNGLEHSGHFGSINFFNSTNQERSLVLVDEVLSYIQNSTYQEQIVGLEVANEPNVYDSHDLAIYKTYLTTSYDKLQTMNQATNRNLTMMFHDGFLGSSKFEDVFTTCSSVVVDYHQYFFDTANSLAATQRAICAVSTASSLRTFYGEWSLSFGYSNDSISWLQSAYETQVKIYDNTTGSAFWSFKVYNTDGTLQNNAWSLTGLIEAGAITANGTWVNQHDFC